MQTAFACPACGASIPVTRADALKWGKCPRCGRAVQAPSFPAEPPTQETVLTPSLAPKRGSSSRIAPPRSTTRLTDSSSTQASTTQQEVEEARTDPARCFGPFVLLEELGRGGMGVVHRAFDDRLRRIVALKTIAPSAGLDQAKVQRFRREAEAVARLKHACIVSVHDAGELQGTHYISMDYVRGKSLDQRLRPPDKISLTRALEAMREVAKAVHYAHEQGVVHRDLKPQNIILDEKDHPWVLDFGLASVRGADSKLTQTGMSMGTPAYMPPEQAAGESTDERSDVYSLGATLYHILTGAPAFAGEGEVNLIVKVLTKDPIPPGTINPRVAGDLETICTKAMEKEPARRYATAGELAEELERYLAGEPIAARPLGPVERLVRRARRNKLKAALVALAVLLVLTLAGAGAYVLEAERRNKAALEAERENAVQAERDRTKIAARADARTAWETFSKVLERKPEPGLGAEVERRRTDEVLASGLKALQAAMRFAALSRDDKEAREGAFRTASAFGRAALDAGQWSVAASAFEEAKSLGVDDARAKEQLGQVAVRRRAREDEHRKTVEDTIQAALSRSPQYDREDALFALVRLGEPETVRLLAAQVDESTRLLADVRRTLLVSAAEPTREEALTGAQGIAGLASALDAFLALKPGEHADPTVLQTIDRAGKRVVEREARRRPVGSEVPTIQGLIAGAQLERLGLGRVELTRLACEALGRIGIREGALDALLRYLYADSDTERATAAAIAICRLGGEDVERLVRGSPHSSSHLFGTTIDRVLGRSAPAAASQEARDARQLFDRGMARIRSGDLDGAIADLVRSLELDPGTVETRINLGVVRGMKGDIKGALAELTRATEEAPANASAWQNLGIARGQSGDTEGAIAAFGHAIEIDPRAPGNYMNRGTTRARSKDLDGAVADLSRAIELDGSFVPAWRNRGTIRMQQGKIDEAMSDLTRAIELDPRDAEALAARGRARKSKKEYAGALEDLNRAIDAAPRLLDGWHERGHLRLVTRDYDGAIADFGRAIELDPRDGHYLRDRGSARQKKGDAAGAIVDLTRAIELTPDFAASYSDRASARRDAGDPKGAVDDATRAIELAPGDFRGWLERGLARGHLADREGGLADLTKAIEIAPTSPTCWADRADALREKGDYPGAIKDATKAIEVAPKDFAGWMIRGRVRSEAGDYDAAVSDLTHAIELEPFAAINYAFRGNARYSKGDLDAAIADYTRAIELEPRDGWTWLNRSLAHEKANDKKAAISDLEKALEVTNRPEIVSEAKKNLARLRGQ